MNTLTEEQNKNIKTLYNWLKEGKDVPDVIHNKSSGLCLFQVIKTMRTKRYNEVERKLLNSIVEQYNKTN